MLQCQPSAAHHGNAFILAGVQQLPEQMPSHRSASPGDKRCSHPLKLEFSTAQRKSTTSICHRILLRLSRGMLVIRRMDDGKRSYTAIFLPGEPARIFPTSEYEHSRIQSVGAID